MRVACSSLPFTHRPLAEVIDLIAGLGFSGWELAIRGDRVHLGHLDPDDLVGNPDLADTIMRAQARHPEVACVGAGFEMARSAPLERETKLFSSCCALLQRLNAPAVTIFLYDDGAAPVAERYLAMHRVAADYGLRLRVETHLNTATANPHRALELCRQLSCELTLDASHYVMQGLPLSTYAPLFTYVGAVQVRACAPGRMELPASEFIPKALIPPAFLGDVIVEYIDRTTDWTATLGELRKQLSKLS